MSPASLLEYLNSLACDRQFIPLQKKWCTPRTLLGGSCNPISRFSTLLSTFRITVTELCRNRSSAVFRLCAMAIQMSRCCLTVKRTMMSTIWFITNSGRVESPVKPTITSNRPLSKRQVFSDLVYISETNWGTYFATSSSQIFK